MHTHTNKSTRSHMHKHTHRHTFASKYIHIHTNQSTHIHMYTHTHTHTHTHTDTVSLHKSVQSHYTPAGYHLHVDLVACITHSYLSGLHFKTCTCSSRFVVGVIGW